MLQTYSSTLPNVQLWYDQYLPASVTEVHKNCMTELFGLDKTPEEIGQEQDARNAGSISRVITTNRKEGYVKVARGIGCFLRASFSRGMADSAEASARKGMEAFHEQKSSLVRKAKSTTIAATVFLLPALLLIVIFMIYRLLIPS